MADAKSLFQIIIEGVDRFSAPIEHMAQRAHAFSAPIREIGDRFEHLNKVTGLEKIGEQFKHVGESIAGAGEKLVEFIGPFAVLAGIGSIAGLGEMAVKVSESGERIHDAAIKIGIDAESLQKLDFAGKLNSVAPEALEKGLTKLNRVLGDAAAGKNKNAASMFQHLGIAIRDVNGHVLSAAQVLPGLSDALKRNENPAIRTRIAVTAFAKAGAEMLPMLVQGSEKLREWGEEAEKTGILTNRQVDSAKQFADRYTILKNSIEGVVNAIGGSLFPVLTPLVEKMTEWVQQNRALIATKIEHVVEQLAAALKRIDWQAVEDGVKGLLARMGWLVDKIGGVQNAILGLIVIMTGPLIAAIWGIAAAFVGLATALIANPVGALIFAAVGALALSAGLIITHWTEVKKVWTDIWSGMASEVRNFWAIVEPVVDFLTHNRLGQALSNGLMNAIPGLGAGRFIFEHVGGMPAPAGGPAVFGGLPFPAPERSPFGGFPALAPAPTPFGGPPSPAPPPSLLSPRPADSQTRLTVEFRNAPPGTRVNTETQGPAPAPDVNVGYNMRGMTAR